MNLKELVEDKCQEIVDEIVENRKDLKHEDAEETFDAYLEEMFDSCEDWWEFQESELNIDNINELLQSYESMKQEFGEPAEQSLSVHYLLTLYGYWFAKTVKDKYVNVLKDAFENMEEQSEEN